MELLIALLVLLLCCRRFSSAEAVDGARAFASEDNEDEEFGGALSMLFLSL